MKESRPHPHQGRGRGIPRGTTLLGLGASSPDPLMGPWLHLPMGGPDNGGPSGSDYCGPGGKAIRFAAPAPGRTSADGRRARLSAPGPAALAAPLRPTLPLLCRFQSLKCVLGFRKEAFGLHPKDILYFTSLPRGPEVPRGRERAVNPFPESPSNIDSPEETDPALAIRPAARSRAWLRFSAGRPLRAGSQIRSCSSDGPIRSLRSRSIAQYLGDPCLLIILRFPFRIQSASGGADHLSLGIYYNPGWPSLMELGSLGFSTVVFCCALRCRRAAEYHPI